ARPFTRPEFSPSLRHEEALRNLEGLFVFGRAAAAALDQLPNRCRMQRRVGQVQIESIAAESEKFAAPLIFIHGLWCTCAVWRRCMGFFAHRGWTSYALNLRGRDPAASDVALGGIRFADHLGDLTEVLAACSAPAILVGHDL